MSLLLEMSIAGALFIMVISLARALVMHRLPKKTFMILWCIVLFRLLIPFSIPSPASVFNLMEEFGNTQPPVPQMAVTPVASDTPDAQLPMIGFTWHIQPDLAQPDASAAPAQANTAVSSRLAAITSMLMPIYLAGLIVSAMFFAALYIKHRRSFAASLSAQNDFVRAWLEGNKLKRRIDVRISDKIATPLTYGILRPIILLPKDTDWSNTGELSYVLAHELIHIKRFDTLAKFVMVAALCVHWFNPAVWVMCFIFNRDMEISCDEAVIKMFGDGSKQSYARTLIGMAERSSDLPVLCNNFSKYAIEERINAIMKMKKRTILGTIAAFLLIGTTVTVFATTAPGLAVASYQSRQLNLDVIELGDDRRAAIGVPGENDISVEEAAQVGANALEVLFGANLDDATISMSFSARTEAMSGRGNGMDTWSADIISQWVDTLGMSIDEILDYARAASERDYTFEIGLDVSSLADAVGLTSGEFINILLDAYIRNRTVAVVEGWAATLGITYDELLDRLMVFDDNSQSLLENAANTVGIGIDDFIFILGSVWNTTHTSWEMPAQPAMWHGWIITEGALFSQYSFTVNAETGELIGANYNPWAALSVGMDRDEGFMFVSETGAVELDDEQNRKFSEVAMDILDMLNVLDDEIEKARILTVFSHDDPFAEQFVTEASVDVRFEGGAAAILIFRLIEESEPIFISVRVNAPYELRSNLEFEWIIR